MQLHACMHVLHMSPSCRDVGSVGREATRGICNGIDPISWRLWRGCCRSARQWCVCRRDPPRSVAGAAAAAAAAAAAGPATAYSITQVTRPGAHLCQCQCVRLIKGRGRGTPCCFCPPRFWAARLLFSPRTHLHRPLVKRWQQRSRQGYLAMKFRQFASFRCVGNGRNSAAVSWCCLPRLLLTPGLQPTTASPLFAQANTPSVVNITALRALTNYSSLDVQRIPAGSGSGFVWDRLGHVVSSSSRIVLLHCGVVFGCVFVIGLAA
jgi:hypothetical protein